MNIRSLFVQPARSPEPLPGYHERRPVEDEWEVKEVPLRLAIRPKHPEPRDVRGARSRA